ncbi:MAG TPA: phosphoribosylglycinamide formyltransferase [Flavitalea sp.]|nr:phosphoribosylglycinamide formyltransferase [Flavitalea sp.]
MFERLQTKWKVNGTQLFLVLCVFAVGGSATGWLGKIIMNWLSIDRGWLWTLCYIIMITLIWPITVLLVSVPFGQFSFFTRYLARIGRRMKIIRNSGLGTQNSEPKTHNSEVRTQNSKLPPAANIAIFASGTGSNASRIIEYFHQKHEAIATVKLIVCNKPGAGVVEVARENRVPTLLIDKEKFFRGNAYVDELKAAKIDFIVLAGFLWKIPQNLIYHYRNKIINIHPALLPKFGGKGMYGSRVHEAVINCGEHESGITIHYVDEHYDNGDVIFQKRVPVADNETPESLASKIHDLEHTHYPMIIEQLLLQPIGR